MEAEFRKKVFDENLFQCSLEVVSLMEKIYASPQSSDFSERSGLLRKIFLEAFTINSSTEELHTFFKTLNTTDLKAFEKELPLFFDGATQTKALSEEIFSDYLTTLRHLTQISDFTQWPLFFKTLGATAGTEKASEPTQDFLTSVRHLVSLGDGFKNWEVFFKTSLSLSSMPAKIQSDFLMSLRHLTELAQFHHWEDYFHSTTSLTAGPTEVLEDFFMTARHLAGLKDFTSWEGFFKTAVTVSSSSAKTQLDVFMTIRHLAERSGFSLWDHFFKAIVTLSSTSDESISGFAVAVRHALDYFQKDETYEALFKVLGSNNVLHAFEAYSYGQLESKKWLTTELKKIAGKEWGTVFILAGWIGSLAQFIFDTDVEVTKIRNFELDPVSCKMSERLINKQVLMDWKYKAVNMDITLMSYPTHYLVKRHDGSVCELYDEPHVIINTSCEHIEHLQQWWSKIPAGTRVVVQNNNAFNIPDHIHCVKSLEEFKAQLPMAKIEYAGELALSDYTRYMMIGQK